MTREEILDLVCECLGAQGIFPGGVCTGETRIDEWPMEVREQFLHCLVNKGMEKGVGILLGVESLAPPKTVEHLIDLVEASI